MDSVLAGCLTRTQLERDRYAARVNDLEAVIRSISWMIPAEVLPDDDIVSRVRGLREQADDTKRLLEQEKRLREADLKHHAEMYAEACRQACLDPAVHKRTRPSQRKPK